jgi:hypothetical protein
VLDISVDKSKSTHNTSILLQYSFQHRSYMIKIILRSFSRNLSPFRATIQKSDCCCGVLEFQLRFNTASYTGNPSRTSVDRKMKGSIQDFLDFVNASPTRENALVHSSGTSDNGNSFSHSPICQGKIGPGWLFRNSSKKQETSSSCT